MFKNPLKKIVIHNKRDSAKNLETKRILLNPNQVKGLIFDNYKKDANYYLENKENYYNQNSNENYKINNAPYSARNNNYYNINDKILTNEKLANQNKNKSKIVSYLIKPQNNNLFYNLKIVNKNYNNNYGKLKYINNLDNFVDKYNNEDCHTTRNSINVVKKPFIQKCNSFKFLEIKPKIESESNKNINYNNNHKFNLSFRNTYFLPENKSDKKTLILDLDETLIHSSYKPFNIKNDIIIKMKSPKAFDDKHFLVHVLKRPYVDIFLSIVCDIFEVVIFTASLQEYANPILDEIDAEKKIKYRLYRDHCIKIEKDKYIKNLNLLGRDLKNVIIIDNNPTSYILNVSNGLPISSWESCQSDNELIKLIPLLQFLSKNNVVDVRPIIQRIVKNNEINYNIVNKLINHKNDILNMKMKDTISNSRDKIITDNYRKGIYPEEYSIKAYNEKDKKIFNQINKKINNNQLNNVSNLSNYISNNQKILNNIFVNSHEKQFLIKKINKNSNSKISRGRSEIRKINTDKNYLFYENEPKNNYTEVDIKTNFNLPDNYIIKATQSKKINIENLNYPKTNLNKNKCNNILNRINKSNYDNRKREVKIPIPYNSKCPIPIDKKNIKNKNSGIKKNVQNSQNIQLNYSDTGLNMRKNSSREKNLNSNLKYPTLKNLFYHKIYKNYINKIEPQNRSQKLIYFKRNDNNNNKNNINNQNYSLENYLNNKMNLNILDNNLDNFIKSLKIKGRKKTLSESKGVNSNKNNKYFKDNNSLIIRKFSYNNIPLKESKSYKILKNNYSVLK